MIAIIRGTLLTAVGFALMVSESRADNITFTYNGATSQDGGDTSSGTGSISFNATGGSVGLGQVTAFNFTLTTDLGFHFTYGLSNLTTFSLSSASATGTIDLVTAFLAATETGTLPENFTWTGALPTSTGQVMAFQPPPNSPFNVDTGPVNATYTVTGVPEPASLALIFAALALTAPFFRKALASR